MRKTTDFFKKISDTKGTFHAKMGTIKDRNGMDLTEAEGEGIGNPLQSYYLENPTQIGAWWGSKGSQRVGYK